MLSTKDKIQSLIDSGLRIEQIALDLDVGVTTVVQWLRKGTEPRRMAQAAIDAYFDRKLGKQGE